MTTDSRSNITGLRTIRQYSSQNKTQVKSSGESKAQDALRTENKVTHTYPDT